MKVKFTESFRMRVMMYTCISLLAAVLTDLAVLFLCIRSRILVSDYGLNNMNIHAGNNNYVLNNSRIQASTKSILSESNIFYRIFGVGIKVQLIIILFILALVVFLLVFFALTHQVTGYITTILQGACKMADGDFSHRIDVRYQDEFSCIADSINRMADAVETMKKKEEKAEETKNELITNVAHDLRTPLTSIIGYIDIVNNMPDLTEAQRSEYLKITWEKARKLEKLINELFSFTKISYGGMPMHMEKIDLIKLLEQEVDELYPTFKDNELECVLETDTDSCMVMADGEQLVRVFDNLLGNAVKYGRYGKMIRVRTVAEQSQIRIQVVNYGSVIPAENLPFLFEKFYKVDTSRQPSSEGTGLGLAIAKSIVESHGGSISVKSSFDGTVFEVILPTAEKAQNEVA